MSSALSLLRLGEGYECAYVEDAIGEHLDTVEVGNAGKSVYLSMVIEYLFPERVQKLGPCA